MRFVISWSKSNHMPIRKIWHIRHNQYHMVSSTAEGTAMMTNNAEIPDKMKLMNISATNDMMSILFLPYRSTTDSRYTLLAKPLKANKRQGATNKKKETRFKKSLACSPPPLPAQTSVRTTMRGIKANRQPSNNICLRNLIPAHLQSNSQSANGSQCKYA